MKNILCYGDSNTWGTVPGTRRDRLPYEERWPGALQKLLGVDYYVIEEGLSGRTTISDDLFEDGRNGKKLLLPILRTHRPLDLVVLMLGTNDLKARFAFTASDIARGAGLLCGMVLQSDTGRGGKAPGLLLVAPAPLATLNTYAEEFEGGPAKSLLLGKYYEIQAAALGCGFLDAGSVIASSPVDGLHIDPQNQRRLAAAVADWVLAQ
jgi:lysophospholipase L1-like esterase